MKFIGITLCMFIFSFFSTSVFAQDIQFTKEKITIETAEKKKLKFTVELALSEEQRRQGLMGRVEVKPKTGMLFIFEKPMIAEFWMKDTLVPLDMLFIDQTGEILHIHERAKPHDLTPIGFSQPVKAVLEITGGDSSRLGIKKGDFVRAKPFTR